MSRIGWEDPDDQIEANEASAEAGFRARVYFYRIVIVAVLGILLLQVIRLQQFQGTALQELATENQIARLSIDAPRGVIFDRNGAVMAENLPSFNVTIIPAFLPDDDDARAAVYERLSLLTSVPVTNTLAQETLAAQADPATVGRTSRLASLYGQSVDQTLDGAGIVPQLEDSIAGTVERFSFAQYLPAVITRSVPITLANVIAQESVFMPGVRVIAEPLRNYPTRDLSAHIVGFMGPLPDESYLALGYERDDRVGLFGLESSMEEALAGTKGERQIEVDATGREVRQIGTIVPPTPGLNLHLTLDLELQAAAQESLQRWMQNREDTPDEEGAFVEVQQGSVVALNPQTGEVLAMVNLPTFDNNRFATEIPVDYYLRLIRNDYQPLFNHAIGGQFPPGSVFKIVTGAAALQENIISPGRLLNAPGSIVIPNRFAPNDPGRAQEFVCWINAIIDPETGETGEHGPMNMYTAMSNSCDIYFYKITGGFDQDGERVDALGIESLKVYANQFGLGIQQGIQLPAEAPGNIPSRAYKRQNFGEPWSTGDDYNTSIGQGFVTSTPLQIAQMAAVIANGGFLYRPTIIHHMEDANGNVVLETADGSRILARPGPNNEAILTDPSGNPISADQANLSVSFDADGEFVYRPEVINVVDVNPEYIDVIAEGMRLVNDEGGTGRTWPYLTWLDEWGIDSAGKTGTAEYCDNIAQSRGWCNYEGGVQPTHGWYVGYAPYDDPEIVVAAFLFNAGEGSRWAAPVVQDVMRAYFQVGDYAP